MQSDSAALGLPSGRRRFVAGLAFAFLFFSTWEIYGRMANPLIFPPVSDVLAAFIDLVTSGRLWEALWPSLRLLAAGFALALVVGLVLGVVIGRSRVADLTFSPYLAALYATPDIALVPIILVWFGFDFSGRVVVVFLSAIFPILYNVTAGVRQAPTDLIDVARSFGAGRMRTLFQVILPSAVPFIMAGIRLSIGRAVVGMAVAEVYLRLGGIGGLIYAFGARFVTDYLIASILVLPILGIGLTRLLAILERRIAPWKTV
ncbi:MAG: ABC transporter permease [Chloroflexota bacterium]|nr:ABC transporter permease [Chloroflexota bacterium]